MSVNLCGVLIGWTLVVEVVERAPNISIRKLAVLELLTVHVSFEVMRDLLLDIDIDAQIILLGSQAGYSSQTVPGSIPGDRISCTRNRSTPVVFHQPTRAATPLPGASTKRTRIKILKGTSGFENQGPADLQSAALTTELCIQVGSNSNRSVSARRNSHKPTHRFSWRACINAGLVNLFT